MVFEYTCPFCGDKFKIGYDPVKKIDYPDCSIELRRDLIGLRYTTYTTEIEKTQICESCYDKMVGEIKITERRIRSEQPKFP